MPELDLENPELLREIVEITRFWLDKGAGGFRLDAVKYFILGDDRKNIEFLKWLGDECKKIKDDVYIVGENWSAISSILSYYEAVNCFDFQFAEGSGYVAQAARGRGITQYASRLETYQNLVLDRNPNAIMNPFISNHDMDRAAGYLTVDDYAMHVAANIYILSSGSPFIYYGEEIGMKGSRGNAQTDANRRLAMLWGDEDTVRDPIGSTFGRANQTNGTVRDQLPKQDSLLTHYKKLIRLRRANPEIARGTVKALEFSGYNTFGGFVSDYMGSKVGVFHNTGENEITLDLGQYTDVNFSVVRGYAGKGRASLRGTTLTLSGFTSAVLR
jgi:glycosidase